MVPFRLRLRLRRAFTLVELLVAVAIVAVLAALLLPSARQAVEAARSARCSANLRQIQVALAAFAGDNEGGIIRWVDGSDYWFNVLSAHGYITGAATNNGHNVWRCPSNLAGTSYAAPMRWETYAINAVDHAVSYDRQYGPSMVADSPTRRNRVVALESPATTIAVCDGTSWLVNTTGNLPAAPHDGGMNAAFWDGHVEHFPAVLPLDDIRFAITKHKAGS